VERIGGPERLLVDVAYSCRSVRCQLDLELPRLERFVEEATLGECAQQRERLELECHDARLSVGQRCRDRLLEAQHLGQVREPQIELLQVARERLGLEVA